ncbi:hypothetical protein ACSBR1_014825 [Camellia fascicularis]
MELQSSIDWIHGSSIFDRDVIEARDSEHKAWAHVQTLRSSLDEQTLELQVKISIGAEAISHVQEKSRLPDILKSKHEENEAYISELETIGQAYDDMQAQNQQLLQQITERDNYNVKRNRNGGEGEQRDDVCERRGFDGEAVGSRGAEERQAEELKVGMAAEVRVSTAAAMEGDLSPHQSLSLYLCFGY